MSIGSGDGLALNRRQAITWTNADPVHRRIYVALGGDKLSKVRIGTAVVDIDHTCSDSTKAFNPGDHFTDMD